MKRIFKLLFRTLLVLFILLNIVTAFHGYKFTHFYNASEVTVKPEAEKTGWDKLSDALFGITAIKKPNKSVPDTNFQTIQIKNRSGIPLESWYIAVPGSKGTVCLFHGHGGNKAGVIAEAREFNRMGYNTILTDFRAHGASGGNICTIGYNESEDVKAVYDHIKAGGEKNILLWGISMGAVSVAKAVADYGIEPSRIILEMPFGTLLEAAEGRIRMMKLPAEPLASMVIFWGGIEQGFWAFNMKPTGYMSKIKCPVLLQWGRNDPRVTESETNALFAGITTPKKLVIYEQSGHQSLCSNENKKWTAEVSSFLAAH